jgi:hypothetical protein
MEYFNTSSGRIELEMSLDQAQTASHQGRCDEDVEALCREPGIRAQLDAIDPQLLIAELLEYGAWETDELQDHETNLQRLLWLAAGDIIEESRQ